MKFREPTKLHRKSRMWGTRRLVAGIERKARSPKIGACDSDATKMRRGCTHFKRSHPLANVFTEQCNGDGSEGGRITLQPCQGALK
jgi:hypothetical protein